MAVDQYRKQSLFGDISSMLRMHKTSAVGILFKVFLCQIQQFKRMTIISNSIKHYRFGSCLRPYLLACSPIKYLKMAKKASSDVSASCNHTRSSIQHTINSIAACARKQGARGRFRWRKLAFKCLESLKTRLDALQNTNKHALTHSGANNHA